MTGFILSLLVAHSGFFLERFGGHGAMGKVMGGLADKMITLKITSADDDEGSGDANNDSETDEDSDLEIIPPIPPVPPIPPIPPVPRVRKFQVPVDPDSGQLRDLPRFTEKARNVPTADVLHRIAQTAGWSITLVGSPKERIDVDVKDADPREALRQVLKQSGSMGVLKSDKLVVVATPDAQGAAGTLIEKSSPSRRNGVRLSKGSSHRGTGEIVRVLQGDLTVRQGQVVQGDVVCVGGSIEMEPGSVVQGDTVAVGGGVSVSQGALVMGQAVLSPIIATFAVTYLIGVVVLRMWPDRVRNVRFGLFANPMRSLIVGCP